MIEWDELRSALLRERLPALVVDLRAFDRNVERIAAEAQRTNKTIRIGTKSLRSVALLRRILAHPSGAFQGALSFTYDEAAFLLEKALIGPQRDVMVAYPSVQRGLLEQFVSSSRGARALAVVDAVEHVEALAAVAGPTPIDAVLDLDVSFHRAGLHLGVRRSGLRSAGDVAQFLDRVRSMPQVRIAGLLAYEAHVAGLPGQGVGPRAFRALAFPEVMRLRREAVAVLREHGIAAPIVNAGGTGSLTRSLEDPSSTEVTVGSGFLCSHLFDGASELDLEPALFIALEVGRIPDADHVTANGGGYVASGQAGTSRLPIPYLPRGMTLVNLEGAGEVQTPLFTRHADRAPRIGDPVLLRPAKAGEIAERFAEHLWLEGAEIVQRSPTYRGLAQTFL